MRYSSTLIGMGMRYSFISMVAVVLGLGPRVSGEVGLLEASLGWLRYPNSIFKQAGRESCLSFPEWTNQSGI